MGLIHEATAMLTAGIGMTAQEVRSWDDGECISSIRSTVVRRVVHSTGEVFYEVVDTRKRPEGDVLRYTDPVRAVHTFARLVGRSSLSGAVAAHRYAFLFPRGSSLDWSRQRRRPAPARIRLVHAA